MDTTGNKIISSLKGTGVIAVLMLVLLALWHGIDILAAVRECGDRFLISGYIMLAAGLTAVGILSAVILRADSRGLYITITLLIFLLGAANVYVFKGLSAPDEVSHYISAYKLSDRMLGEPVCDEHGRVYVRACDLYLEDTKNNLEEARRAADAGESTGAELKIFGQTLDESVYRVYATGMTGDTRSMEETGLSSQWSVNTTALAYLPQAIGISIARLAGLNSLWLITLGKLCNLVFFTAMCALALYLMPRAKEILAGVMLIPETLHLAGSMSYDVFVMACSFVYIALIADIAEHGCGKVKLTAAALVIGILAPCKLIYSLLLMLLLTLIWQHGAQQDSHRMRSGLKSVNSGNHHKEQHQHKERHHHQDTGWRAYIILAVLSIVAVCISMYIVNAVTIGNYASADERVISWAEEAQGYTVSYLIHRPLELLGICYRTVLMKTGNWFATMFGLYLGNQDPVLNVPYPVIGLYAAGLFLIAAGTDYKPNAAVRAIHILTFAAVTAALMGSMLIAYTPMSSTYIEGVQGRYLLPVLPVLLMGIPGSWIRLRDGTGRNMLMMFVIAECYVLIRVYATVAMRIG